MPESPQDKMRLKLVTTSTGCDDPAVVAAEWYNRHSVNPEGINELRLDAETSDVDVSACPVCMVPSTASIPCTVAPDSALSPLAFRMRFGEVQMASRREREVVEDPYAGFIVQDVSEVDEASVTYVQVGTNTYASRANFDALVAWVLDRFFFFWYLGDTISEADDFWYGRHPNDDTYVLICNTQADGSGDEVQLTAAMNAATYSGLGQLSEGGYVDLCTRTFAGCGSPPQQTITPSIYQIGVGLFSGEVLLPMLTPTFYVVVSDGVPLEEGDSLQPSLPCVYKDWPDGWPISIPHIGTGLDAFGNNKDVMVVFKGFTFFSYDRVIYSYTQVDPVVWEA